MRLSPIVAVIVLFMGCIDDKVQPTATTLSDTVLQGLGECEKMADTEFGRDECFWSLGIGSRRPDICGRIRDSRFRDDCYWTVGIALDDATICENISDPYPKRLCEAITEKTPAICERIGEGSADVPDQGRIDMCRALVGRDTTFCGGSSNADGCYLLMSRVTGDKTLCEMIKSSPAQYGLCKHK